MTAFNVVRMRVKTEAIEDYLAFHRDQPMDGLTGMKSFNMIRTGDQDFCIIGEWTDMDALAAARPTMVAMLDNFRDRLEDLGGGLGVTDPISGEVVIERRA